MAGACLRIRAGAGGIVSGRMPAKRCRRVPSRCRGDPATRSPTDCLTDWPFGSLRRLLHARLNTTPRVEIMRRNERPWIVGKFKLHANSGMRSSGSLTPLFLNPIRCTAVPHTLDTLQIIRPQVPRSSLPDTAHSCPRGFQPSPLAQSPSPHRVAQF